MVNKITWNHPDGYEMYFYNDGEHPWPYYEGLCGPDGMGFDFLIPKSVSKEEIQSYKRKLRNERDVVDIRIYRS